MQPLKTISLRVRVEVQISTRADNAVAEAVAELRRTLEKEGYRPSIDVTKPLKRDRVL